MTTISAASTLRGSRAGTPLLALSSLIAALAVVACLAGLFWEAGDGRATVTSVRGEQVDLYGEGLYVYDTVFIAASSRATDVVTLLLGVPLLVFAVVLSRRSSLRAALLFAGVLGYFLYVYASRSLGNAYNGLFPVYIALFSASLFAFILAVTSINFGALASRLNVERPRRGLAAFLLASAAVTAVVWLAPLFAAIARGEAPKYLDTYATTVTDVLDLGVLVPTLVVAAALILRRAALGYFLAGVLLVLLLFVAATIVLGTVFQVAADVSFTTGEIAGPIAGFLVLAGIAAWLLVRLLSDAGRDAPADAKRDGAARARRDAGGGLMEKRA